METRAKFGAALAALVVVLILTMTITVAASTGASSTSSSSSSTSSATLVSEQTTSVTSTGAAAYPSIFLKSSGVGSPSYGTTAGEYGESLAVAGPFLIVGAPNETSGGDAAAGNAYIYNSDTGALLETLTSPSPQALANFGWFVTLAGDLAVVGAPGESVSGMAAAGQVYIFNATTGKLVHTLTSPNAQAEGQFGGDVATSGSLLVVGALAENTTKGFAGRVYVFNVTTGSLVGTLQSPNPQFEGEFGSTVYATPQYVVVGAQNETVGTSVGAGRVYVYSAATLSLVETLVSPAPQEDGDFGFSLASTPSALIVGAPFDTVDGVSGVGNVYAFGIPSWSLVQTLSGPTETQAEPPNFGFQVAAAYGYVAVSAPFNGTVVSSTEITGGAVYLYNETTFAPISGLTAPSESSGYYSSAFGYSISIGPGSLSVGDPDAIELISTSPGYAFPGDAFIFELSTATSSSSSTLAASSSSSSSASSPATSSSSTSATSSSSPSVSTSTSTSHSSPSSSTSSSLPFIAAAALVVAIVIVVFFMVRRRGAQGAAAAPTYPAQPARVFCHSCGSPIESNTKFCPNCGASQPSGQPGLGGGATGPQ